MCVGRRALPPNSPLLGGTAAWKFGTSPTRCWTPSCASSLWWSRLPQLTHRRLHQARPLSIVVRRSRPHQSASRRRRVSSPTTLLFWWWATLLEVSRATSASICRRRLQQKSCNYPRSRRRSRRTRPRGKILMLILFFSIRPLFWFFVAHHLNFQPLEEKLRLMTQRVVLVVETLRACLGQGRLATKPPRPALVRRRPEC